MKSNLLHIIARSLLHYRKAVLLQIVIITILAAVITGSLLTGSSVRESLKSTAFSRLGNTSILVSTGLRYFTPELTERLSSKTGQKTTGILESEGFCQNFSEAIPSGKIKIYGIGKDFFSFMGKDSCYPARGEVIINKRLAERIKVKKGDDLIIRIREISDIPADAPFSTGSKEGYSIVMKIGRILGSEEGGDFSLGISQIVPDNLFIRIDDIAASSGKQVKPNRILSENTNNESTSFFTGALELTPADLGLKLRKTGTGNYEFISSRVFIDRKIIEEIQKNVPSAAPVITYLANSISFNGKETPYSFVSGIPSELYRLPGLHGLVINRWLADDIGASPGDTVTMKWFAPDSVNQLREKSARFCVQMIVGIDSIWGDKSLMPDFPGIAGTESCSDWDAGMELDLRKIRNKDEEYWTKYRGTPKAFISYDTGKELWGSNYGPATAIRFPAGISSSHIEESLNGRFDPSMSGFLVTDLRAAALQAARNSVDFGTLFISLGFFIIFSSALLLSLSVSSWFDNRKEHIITLHAIGFRNRTIRKMLLSEMLLIGIAGSLAGTIAGMLVNKFIIEALNTVWSGAVQTNTLSASASAGPMITGFISSIVLIFLLSVYRTSAFLRSLENKREGIYRLPSVKTNKILLTIVAFLTGILFAASIITGKDSTAAWFGTGILLFFTMVFLLRQYYIGFHPDKDKIYGSFSRKYYSINPSQAVTPAIFIAAGIFALSITSLNRMSFDRSANNPGSGTGGYLLWAETSVPLNEDLSTWQGKKENGLDEEQFSGMQIVQLARKEGDDASCLNLNHITSPPLLGVNPDVFVEKGAFSFASLTKQYEGDNPWKILNEFRSPNTIFGIADQTVLEWGLKIKTGDTLMLRAENGMPLNIIIAAGLKSSVFQGNVIIGASNLKRFFPSVSGGSVFLIGGDPKAAGRYKEGILDRFGNYGITAEETSDRLASFYRVTNTYLSVFTVLGALGMILGVFGLGFVLLKNYSIRAGEFALLNAIGFSTSRIRRSLLKDLLIILTAGIITGAAAGLIATFPALTGNSNVSVNPVILMIIAVFLTGLIILSASLTRIKGESIVQSLRKE
jgi:ABC-type antimicrobial peptide transport system permease subunit